MKVNDLIEFLEYSDRRAPVVVGIVGQDGSVSMYGEVLFLQQEQRVCLIVDPAHQSARATEAEDAIQLAEFDRTQLFGHDFVLLQKPPEQPS